ncbi:MAG: ATP-binding cassette domain-containing protein [Micromonosporaceae bacterium]|nr:ATP-binding cassette domain-containing protein [Micromonosporaceae bacterium]
MTVLEVVDGVVAYGGGRPALDRVTLRVRRGETVAILGANGSGKSTLVRAALGLVPLTSGRVELFGSPLRRFRAWKQIGYVPQRLGAGSGVPATVREVVASGRLARRRLFGPQSAVDRRAVDAAIAAVGLSDRTGDAVHVLSGGQQQRTLIARALAAEPELLVLDEPTAGVDAVSQRTFADALGRFADDGGTVILVAHELGPLEPLVNRAVVLHHGEIAHDGAVPAPVGNHARPGHEHVHPHARAEESRWSPPGEATWSRES